MLIERALLLARACSLAFLPPQAIPSSPYATGLKCVAQVEDKRSLAGATVLSSDDATIIACRGSASLPNFATNFQIGPVSLQTASGPHPSARVHDGFQRASQELWQQIEPCLPPASHAKPLLVTGHSLGGGTATMLALYACEAGRQAELVTVAGPRLGNGAFAKHYQEQCPPAVHLVHDEDEVLSSNVALWDGLGFEHVGRVVKCGKDEACIYEEGEAGCMPTPAATPSGAPSLRGVLVDHCFYLGIYIGVRANHPSVWLRSPFGG